MLFGAASVHAVTCTDTTIPASNPDAAYTNGSDGTVTDTRTGLMWKKCSEGQTGSTCSGTAGAYTWSAALGLAAASRFAGHADWRVPNVKELRSLVEECRTGPAINDTIFPSTPSSSFWSSSPSDYTSTYAWYVYFGNGYSSDYSFRSHNGSVRLVRGGQFLDSFDLLNPDAASPSDCVFNWAELVAPNLFAPPGAVSTTQAPFYYRYYAGTNAYLGTYSANNHLYYLGPATGNTLYDVGPLAFWSATAGCP